MPKAWANKTGLHFIGKKDSKSKVSMNILFKKCSFQASSFINNKFFLNKQKIKNNLAKKSGREKILKLAIMKYIHFIHYEQES